MFTSTITPFLLLALHLSSTNAQFISTLPDCVQTCISDSQDENCGTFDVTCFCKAAAAGNFLTDVVTCIHTQCDSDMANTILLMPLQFACGLAGNSIPDAILSSAEGRASSLATETAAATTTSGGAAATTSADDYPTTASAAASTSTQTTVGSSTASSTQSPAGSTSSPSRSATHTSIATHTVTSSVQSSSSISDASQTSSSTDSASKTSSSSETSSKTSAAPDGGNTDSAPFTNTNDAPNIVGNVGPWFALTIAMAAGFALVLS